MNASVLVVEDEGIVAEDIRQTLVDAGYDAYAIAMSGDEAIARASERCPDIVLMDIRIRGARDGIETAKVVRERFDVPVVFLTAHTDDATVDRAKQTEPYGYLVKPIRTSELRSTIEIALFRHGMEKRLRARERWFETTLRSIGDAVVAVDRAGKISFMNREAETLTGVSGEHALGRPVGEVVRLLDPAQPASPLDVVLAERASVAIKPCELAHATGPNRVISDAATPVVDGDEMLGAVMVFRDVTEQQVLQKRMELADRLASLGTMAAGVAHEINNPLAVVIANTSYLREQLADDPRSGETGDVLADLEAAAQRIARIVADLQAFARTPAIPGRAGHVEPALAWVIRTVGHDLRTRATVTTEIEAGLPPVTLDEARLAQVMVNLLVNAAHAIEPGHADRMSVQVSARRRDDRVVIEVRDTGAGMPPEVLKRVFEPFFTTKPVGVGTGLGLSICHGIVTSVGGTIEAESQLGVGSVFRIALPITQAPAVAAPTTRGRVLLIDDEPMVLQGMRRVLRDHDVTCLDDAREALAMIARGERFDVIITDVMMPRMTGMAFYEALVSTHPDIAARVVFVTGGSANARVQDFLAAVPNTCIQKPIPNAELRALVQQRLA